MNPIPESQWNYVADERPAETLLALALSRDMDQDNEEFWDPVRCLQFRLPRIADRIEALLQSPAAKSRHVAATVLGQNSVKDKWEAARCARSLLAALPIERELPPLGTAWKPDSDANRIAKSIVK